MQNRNDKIKEDVLNQIKAGKVKLRSKYIFLAEKLGLGSSFVLSILLAVLFFNLLLFYLKSTDSLIYLTFGRNGIFAFLESFPYLLVVVLILFIVLSGYIISKTDFSYKKSFSFVALCLVVFVIITGVMATYTSISREINRRIEQNHPIGSVFRPFMGDPSMMRDRGIAGRLVEIGEEILKLETPHGIEMISIIGCVSCDGSLSEGDFIVGIGERDKDIFRAVEIRNVEEENLGVVRDRTLQRFGYFECRDMPSSTPCEIEKNKRDCVRECIEERLEFEKCREKCDKR